MNLKCREQYEPGSGMHRLWFSTGGSAGHSSLIGLDIFEGIFDPQGAQPRVWDVNVLKAQEVISSEQRRSEQRRREEAKEKESEGRAMARLGANRRKMAVALHNKPEGDMLTGLAAAAGLSRKRAREAIEVLIEKGVAISCKVAKGRGNRELHGFQLAHSDEAE